MGSRFDGAHLLYPTGWTSTKSHNERVIVGLLSRLACESPRAECRLPLLNRSYPIWRCELSLIKTERSSQHRTVGEWERVTARVGMWRCAARDPRTRNPVRSSTPYRRSSGNREP